MSESKSDPEPASADGSGRILVAVDFSDDAEAALLWACDYARQVGADITVLHVVHDPSEAPGYYKQEEANVLRPAEDVAKGMMEDFLAQAAQNHPEVAAARTLDTKLVKGIPATRILEAARSMGARMIVMGSQGRTGLPHLLLGSKAERVVQMSPIPVTIVKAKKNAE